MTISDKAKELLEQFDDLTREYGYATINHGSDQSSGHRLTKAYLSAKADLVQYIASLEHKALAGTSGQDFGKD
jgi:hypothetical protein